MKDIKVISLKQNPELKLQAASWFNDKWKVPTDAYLECMDYYLEGKTDYGWYLCLDDDKIVAGLGVIKNDFHERKDLTPNICAVYTDKDYRGLGLAGKLLNTAVEDLRNHDISPVYLFTDLVGFYERYGWRFFDMVKNEGEESLSRMYVHY